YEPFSDHSLNSILQETTAVNTCGNPRWREPRPCSSWGQVAHVLTPDNFRLSPGKKDFTAPQGLRTSIQRSSSAVSNSGQCGSVSAGAVISIARQMTSSGLPGSKFVPLPLAR